MALLRNCAVPVLLGVTLGALIARFAEPWVFRAFFLFVTVTNALTLLPVKGSWRVACDLPTGGRLRMYGGLVGLLSALMGIGGGAIANLILPLHGRPIHQTVATSAAVGGLISIPGSTGYVLAGWDKLGLPSGSLGFVSLLGFAPIVPTTFPTTGFGVGLAHRLPQRNLDRAFGTFPAQVSLRFLLILICYNADPGNPCRTEPAPIHPLKEPCLAPPSRHRPGRSFPRTKTHP